MSAVSLFEIETKRRLGKLEAPRPMRSERCATRASDRLPLTLVHAELGGRLNWAHRDPFDRLLVAQSRMEGRAAAHARPRDPRLRADRARCRSLGSRSHAPLGSKGRGTADASDVPRWIRHHQVTPDPPATFTAARSHRGAAGGGPADRGARRGRRGGPRAASRARRGASAVSSDASSTSGSMRPAPQVFVAVAPRPRLVPAVVAVGEVDAPGRGRAAPPRRRRGCRRYPRGRGTCRTRAPPRDHRRPPTAARRRDAAHEGAAPRRVLDQDSDHRIQLLQRAAPARTALRGRLADRCCPPCTTNTLGRRSWPRRRAPRRAGRTERRHTSGSGEGEVDQVRGVHPAGQEARPQAPPRRDVAAATSTPAGWRRAAGGTPHPPRRLPRAAVARRTCAPISSPMSASAVASRRPS